MDRRNFIQKVGIGLAAATIAPLSLLPESQPGPTGSQGVHSTTGSFGTVGSMAVPNSSKGTTYHSHVITRNSDTKYTIYIDGIEMGQYTSKEIWDMCHFDLNPNESATFWMKT